MEPGAQDPRATSPEGEAHDERGSGEGAFEKRLKWAMVAGGSALALYGLSRRSKAGVGIAAGGAALVFRGATGHFPAVPTTDRVRIEETVRVNRGPDEVFRIWRGSERLPLLLGEVDGTATTDGEDTLRWIATTLFGRTIEWDVEIAEERPPEYIAWRSAPGTLVEQSVSIQLTPAPGGGTEVHLAYVCDVPGGPIGGALAPLGRRLAEARIKENLRRFKVWMDAGDIPTTQGQPPGSRG